MRCSTPKVKRYSSAISFPKPQQLSTPLQVAERIVTFEAPLVFVLLLFSWVYYLYVTYSIISTAYAAL